jgi:hypothetical protein
MSLRSLLNAVLTFVVFSVGGCTVFSTSIYQDGEDGIIYYLPKSLISVTVMPFGQKGDNNKPDTIEYLVLQDAKSDQVADNSKIYVLKYLPNAFSTDTLCAGLDSNNLLLAVEASAADETGNIVISISRLAGRLIDADPFSTDASARTAQQPGATVALTHLAIKYTFDPLQPEGFKILEELIRKRFKGFNYEVAAWEIDRLRDSLGSRDCPENYVCYRTMVPIQLVMRDKSNMANVSSVWVSVVSKAVLGQVDVTRAFAVEKITKLGFDHGVLNSVATVKLPLAAVDAVMTSLLAAPGAFLANIGGLPPKEQLELIKQSAALNSELAALREKVSKIEQGDFLARPTPLPADQTFNIRCHGTVAKP